MWAFFSRRFRRYLLFAVGTPVLAWVLEQLREGIVARRGESGLTRSLDTAGGWLSRRRRRRRGVVRRRRG